MMLPFPLVGADHPLRRAQAKTFAESAVIAMAFSSAIAMLLTSRFERGLSPTPEHGFPIEMRPQFSPPPVAPTFQPRVDWVSRVPDIPNAIPVPVPLDPEQFPDELSPFPGTPPDEAPGGQGPAPNGVVVFEGGDGVPSPNDYVPVDTEAELIRMPLPMYPEVARSAGVEGMVTLLVLVDKDGSVRDLRIAEGVDMLNDSALDAARQAIFRPATRGGRPVLVWVALPIRFTLHD